MARDGNVLIAHKMLTDCLNWRIQNEIDCTLRKPIVPSDMYRAIRNSQLVGMPGYTKEVPLEGPHLIQYGFKEEIAKVRLYKFLSDLFWIGMFYHLYNQVATNTLERVAPLTHAVGNVLKRVFVIGFSIVVFGVKELLLSFSEKQGRKMDVVESAKDIPKFLDLFQA